MAEDEATKVPKARFKVDFYFYVLDMLVNQFETRFAYFCELAKLHSVLNPQNFFSDEPSEQILKLADSMTMLETYLILYTSWLNSFPSVPCPASWKYSSLPTLFSLSWVSTTWSEHFQTWTSCTACI